MRFFSAALVGAAIAFSAAAGAQAATVSAGTTLNGTLSEDLSTKDATIGQGFTLTNVSNGSGTVSRATVYGHVSDVTRAGQGKRPQLQLSFDKIVMSNGQTQTISGVVTSANEQTKSNAGREVVGAVVGNIVGNYVGKHVGTNVGGILGAAGGYLYAKNYHENVTIPQGSAVALRVTAARRQAHR